MSWPRTSTRASSRIISPALSTFCSSTKTMPDMIRALARSRLCAYPFWQRYWSKRIFIPQPPFGFVKRSVSAKPRPASGPAAAGAHWRAAGGCCPPHGAGNAPASLPAAAGRPAVPRCRRCVPLPRQTGLYHRRTGPHTAPPGSGRSGRACSNPPSDRSVPAGPGRQGSPRSRHHS